MSIENIKICKKCFETYYSNETLCKKCSVGDLVPFNKEYDEFLKFKSNYDSAKRLNNKEAFVEIAAILSSISDSFFARNKECQDYKDAFNADYKIMLAEIRAENKTIEKREKKKFLIKAAVLTALPWMLPLALYLYIFVI